MRPRRLSRPAIGPVRSHVPVNAARYSRSEMAGDQQEPPGTARDNRRPPQFHCRWRRLGLTVSGMDSPQEYQPIIAAPARLVGSVSSAVVVEGNPGLPGAAAPQSAPHRPPDTGQLTSNIGEPRHVEPFSGAVWRGRRRHFRDSLTLAGLKPPIWTLSETLRDRVSVLDPLLHRRDRAILEYRTAIRRLRAGTHTAEGRT